MLMDQKELFIKNSEIYNITRDLLIFIIETYVEQPFDEWFNSKGIKNRISSTGFSGQKSMQYELNEEIVLDKNRVEEIAEPTVLRKILTDIVLKDYFDDCQKKRAELKTEIEKLKFERDKIEKSSQNTEKNEAEDPVAFDEQNNDQTMSEFELDEDDDFDEYNVATKLAEIEEKITILQLEWDLLVKERKVKIIEKIDSIMNSRNECYAHRDGKVDIIKLGEWSDALKNYIKYDYYVFKVKGNVSKIDDFMKMIRQFRDSLFGNETTAYFFQGVEYVNTDRLIETFALHWNDGIMCIKAENDLQAFMKKQSDLVYSRFKEVSAPFLYIEKKRNQLIAEKMLKQEYVNEVQLQTEYDLMNHVYMFRFLYAMNPKLEKIYWKGVTYTKDKFVDLFLMPVVRKTKKINAKRILESSILYTFAKYGMFSFYINTTRPGKKYLLEAAINGENSIINFVEGNFEDENLSEFYNQIYELASCISDSSFYTFMHEKDHYVPHRCETVSDVMMQMNQYLDEEQDFNKLYRIVIQTITPSFRGWLKHKNNQMIDSYFNSYMRYKEARKKQLNFECNHTFDKLESTVLFHEDSYKLWVVKSFFHALYERTDDNGIEFLDHSYNNIIHLYQKQEAVLCVRMKETDEASRKTETMKKQFQSTLTNKMISYFEAKSIFDQHMNQSKVLVDQIWCIEIYMAEGMKYVKERIENLEKSPLQYCFMDPFLKTLGRIIKNYSQTLDGWEKLFAVTIENSKEDYKCYRYKDLLIGNIQYHKSQMNNVIAQQFDHIKKERRKAYLTIFIIASVLIILAKVLI